MHHQRPIGLQQRRQCVRVDVEAHRLGAAWLDAELRKSFSLKTDILGDGEGEVEHVKVLNRIISWEKGAIVWEADPRHVELLAEQLGLQNAGSVRTPAEKEPSGVARFRDLDGDGTGDHSGFDAVDVALALGEKQIHKEASSVSDVGRPVGALANWRARRPSSGDCSAGVRAREPNNKEGGEFSRGKRRWADIDESEAVAEMPASMRSRQRASLNAEGWHEGADGRWRQRFENAEFVPECDLVHVVGRPASCHWLAPRRGV